MSRPSARRSSRAALLLTDVVDSTRLAEELGDAAMAELWAQHDRVARDLLPPHRGREIDKTDGFLMLFEGASDAVAYAVAYHRALRQLGIAARAGLHVGEVILTENAPEDVARGAKPLEVDGIAKPTAARVMSVAAGGQTLLTSPAVEALGQTDLRLESHGHWRMKGVAEPIELFEVGDDDGLFRPPPDGAKVYRVVEREGLWIPVKQVEHSLPAERDAFVGRQADLRDLARRLDGDARLVSVLGIGGTGKTRLVTRYGWTWLGDYPGGVWFCDLSEARSLEGIVSAVAGALDVPLGQDPVVQLGHAIAGRGPCLVILDNFEQVAGHATATLGRWLDRAAEARFVVTTREVLGLPGEEALALSPLPAAEGAALFVARARSAKRDFEPDDVASIDALVRLLDGLPLAIELAAARVRVMPPAKLLERMGQRFHLLASSGGRRDRQATLRATLDWSWDLLSADEQAALAQLSVFEGGFTLDAVEAVLSLDEAWPMDAVQGLVDKSLVRQVSDDRFDLLVSVQEYAAEKLEAAGGRTETEARHGAHFASCGTDEALEALDRYGGVLLRRELSRELENLVAASRRAVARQDGDVAVDTALAAWAVLELRGPVATAITVLAPARSAAPSEAQGARAASGLATALRMAGRMDEARAHYDAALAAHRAAGDRRLEGIVLGRLGNLQQRLGRIDEARACYDAALLADRAVGNRSAEADVLINLGVLIANQGRADEARAYYDAALAAHREVGNRRGEGVVLANLGNLRWRLGEADEGLALIDAALAAHREVGNRTAEGIALGNLGLLYKEREQMDEALTRIHAALVIQRETGNRYSEGHVLGHLGNLCVDQGRMDEARAHFDAALALHREVGSRRNEGHVLGNLGDVHASQGRIDEALAHHEAALAVHREVQNRIAESWSLGSLVELHLKQGRMEQARACLREGERILREEVESPVWLAILLSKRARLEAHAGDLATARAALSEAEELATRGASRDLKAELAEARQAVDRAARAEPGRR